MFSLRDCIVRQNAGQHSLFLHKFHKALTKEKKSLCYT